MNKEDFMTGAQAAYHYLSLYLDDRFISALYPSDDIDDEFEKDFVKTMEDTYDKIVGSTKRSKINK